MRRLITLVAATLLPLGLLAPHAAAEDANPVIFVHGFGGSGSQWSSMIGDFVDDGWDSDELYPINYSSTRSNERTAGEVQDIVDDVLAETGKSEVDIVTHSMGGLSTRWYIKFLGGDEHVGNWISLGGPNHGTTTAGLCNITVPACRDMQRGSDFLSELNADDPTPGDVNYATWWSSCDAIINPNSSVRLDGADNHRAGCVGHISLMSNRGVSEGVRDYLR